MQRMQSDQILLQKSSKKALEIDPQTAVQKGEQHVARLDIRMIQDF